MTIAKLQQFLAVCQFQSVSRAAEFLHISQPSVSGTIRDLESEFQINLFRHEGRRLGPDGGGKLLTGTGPEADPPVRRTFLADGGSGKSEKPVPYRDSAHGRDGLFPAAL